MPHPHLLPLALLLLVPGARASTCASSALQLGIKGLFDDSRLGTSVRFIGDVDGDGIEDIAVGAPGAGDVAINGGAIYIVLLDASGGVRNATRYTRGGDTKKGEKFGDSLAPMGDLNGDGVPDLAVGVPGTTVDSLHESGGFDVLYLNRDGSVNATVRTTAHLHLLDVKANDHFGSALAAAGDLDGDGVVDLFVGAWTYDDPLVSSDTGCVYTCLMQRKGTPKSCTRIAAAPGFGSYPALAQNDFLGVSVAAVGDLDGNGVEDIVVGAVGDDAMGFNAGAFYVLLLHDAGKNVKSFTKFDASALGDAGADLGAGSRLGMAVTRVGSGRVAVSAANAARGGCVVVAQLTLLADDTAVLSEVSVIGSNLLGGPVLEDSDAFGSALDFLNTTSQLLVGAMGDDDGGTKHVNRGAAYALALAHEDASQCALPVPTAYPTLHPTRAPVTQHPTLAPVLSPPPPVWGPGGNRTLAPTGKPRADVRSEPVSQFAHTSIALLITAVGLALLLGLGLAHFYYQRSARQGARPLVDPRRRPETTSCGLDSFEDADDTNLEMQPMSESGGLV